MKKIVPLGIGNSCTTSHFDVVIGLLKGSTSSWQAIFEVLWATGCIRRPSYTPHMYQLGYNENNPEVPSLRRS